MRILLDTCAVSELTRPVPNAAVAKAISSSSGEDLFLSVLTIGEIAHGVSLLPRGNRRRSLQAWLDALEHDYADRIIGIDLDTARIWGEATAAAKSQGKAIPAIDGLIAATARQHGLRVMTRNAADFEAAGASVINPWRDS
ncbi:MAG: type II toxin-antitoxin system VapC family toxin [Thermodesulfobacteriota bacterium]